MSFALGQEHETTSVSMNRLAGGGVATETPELLSIVVDKGEDRKGKEEMFESSEATEEISEISEVSVEDL